MAWQKTLCEQQRGPSMEDERYQQLGLVLQRGQGISHVSRCQIAQFTVFGPRPDVFVRVRVRRVGREVLHHHHFVMLCQPRLYDLRLAVDVAAVPTKRDGPRSSSLASPLSCRKNNTTSSAWKFSLSANSMKCNPTRALCPRAERDGANHRDSVARRSTEQSL
jgi:hypothetical protein